MAESARKTCFRIRGQFSDAVDGGLDSERAVRFDRHLQQCDECRSHYVGYRRAVEQLHAIPELALTERFTFALMEKIADRRRPVFVRQAFAGVAALLLIVLLTPGQSPLSTVVYNAVRQPLVAVDYVDAASLQPVQLDFVLDRARETNRRIRLVPLVRAMEAHRRNVVESATMRTVLEDLNRYGDAASNVEIDAPQQVDTGSFAPFVVAVEDLPR